MNVDIKIGIVSNVASKFIICPYCLGAGKLKAMQRAMTYDAGSIRVNDTSVKCSHCKGTGLIKEK